MYELILDKDPILQENGVLRYEVDELRVLESNEDTEGFIRVVSGELKIVRQGFGFVEDVHIPVSYVLENGLSSGQQLRLLAYKKWDKKKNAVAWSIRELF